MLHCFDNNESTLEAVIAQYPKENFTDNSARADVILRDSIFLCPSRRMARAMTASGANVYMYRYDYIGKMAMLVLHRACVAHCIVGWLLSVCCSTADFIENKFLGVYHCAEIPFVFSNPWPPVVHSFSKNDTVMAAAFGAYWTNMVKSLNPNLPAEYLATSELPIWPVYSEADDSCVRLDIPVSIESNTLASICDFWDAVGSSALLVRYA
jgi:para-nitrobenzyl esterase